MAGRSTIIQFAHIFLCLVLATKFFIVAGEIQVINAYSDADQIHEFLNNERQHNTEINPNIENPTEPIIVNNEDDLKDIEDLVEYLGNEISEKLKYNEDTNTDDVWEVEMSADAKIISQRFIDNEKRYLDSTNVELVPQHSTNNEKLNTETTVAEAVPERTTSYTNYTVVNDVQIEEVDLMKNDSNQQREVSRTLLEQERMRSELDNAPLKSVQFSVKEDDDFSKPKVDVCGTVNLNQIVDEVIVDLRKDIVEHGFDKIKIPDIHESFKKSVGILSINGDFKAEDGWAKNLSTIQRTADVIASAEGNTLTIACGFGLSKLEFGYDNYKAKFMNFGPSGKIDALIQQDSLLLNATVSWSNSTCKTKLNSLHLNRFGGLKLRITGLGPLNFLVTKISDLAFQKFKVQIREKIESTLIEILDKQLKTFDCTKYMFKYAMLVN